LEKDVAKRQAHAKKIYNMDKSEYSTDPTCGGHGIFCNLPQQALNFDDDEDIKRKYQRMLDYRRRRK